MKEPYYADDHVTLYHGDCLEIAAWLEADVLITDPPYGIAYRQKRSTGKTTRGRREAALARRDGLGEYITFDRNTQARDSALGIWGLIKPGLIFGSWRIPRPKNTLQRLVWIKDGNGGERAPAMGLSNMPWVTCDEEIYVIGTKLSDFAGPQRRSYYITRELRSSPSGLPAQIGHPTPKPVGLMEQLLVKTPQGIVADPFAGSGSTLVAARNLGRQAIGVEIEERYCELIAKRLDQMCLDFGDPA